MPKANNFDLPPRMKVADTDVEGWLNYLVGIINALDKNNFSVDANGRLVVDITGDATTIGGYTAAQLIGGDFVDIKQALAEHGNSYVFAGGVATKDPVTANLLNVTALVGANIKKAADGTLAHINQNATSFNTVTANTIYYLDVLASNAYSFATAHPVGVDYLPIAEVTTDLSGNIAVVTDKRNLTVNPFSGGDAHVNAADAYAGSPDDTQVPAGNPGYNISIKNLLSNVVNRIKAVSGEANWWITPGASLKKAWNRVQRLLALLDGTQDFGNTQTFAQINAPGSAPVVAVNTSAGNVTGTKVYDVTFCTGWVDENGAVTTVGETTASVVSATVTVNSQQVNLSSIPVGGIGVVARRIYRRESTAGAGTEKLVTTLLNNTTTTYTDNVADAALGAVVPATNSTGTKLTLHGLLTASGGINQALTMDYKLSSALPSTYPQGVSLFFTNNTGGWPSAYGTVLTIKAFNNMACVQYFYPYNVDAPAKYRYGLYSTDVWTAWRTMWDSQFDGSGSGLDADLLDGAHAGNASGNVALANGTVVANLNADMVDGVHASSLSFIATGTYTGDGTANRQINVGFAPKYVYVTPAQASWPAWLPIILGPSASIGVAFGQTGTSESNVYGSFNATGFTSGAASYTQINGNGVAYYWVAIG